MVFERSIAPPLWSRQIKKYLYNNQMIEFVTEDEFTHNILYIHGYKTMYSSDDDPLTPA